MQPGVVVLDNEVVTLLETPQGLEYVKEQWPEAPSRGSLRTLDVGSGMYLLQMRQEGRNGYCFMRPLPGGFVFCETPRSKSRPYEKAVKRAETQEQFREAMQALIDFMLREAQEESEYVFRYVDEETALARLPGRTRLVSCLYRGESVLRDGARLAHGRGEAWLPDGSRRVLGEFVDGVAEGDRVEIENGVAREWRGGVVTVYAAKP
ncbi:single stranded DNA-binding domain-containing protein [Paucidesulfovibrio longus]|uniref:hypothetical protein n=1 Tax=Paucidesulfovibrio longus TaxID=889 RepID=UPI0003B4615D|nr:hypothetical protein [Paucidesulfovibrio longus]